MTGGTAEDRSALVLGKRLRGSARNVAKAKDMDIIMFVRGVLRGSPELAAIEARVDHIDGRPRKLRVDVLLAAGIAQAYSGDSMVHIRAIAALLRGLNPPDQRLLDVRYLNPHGRGEQVITERQVEYLFAQIAYAFTGRRNIHNHPFVLDGEVWSVDGELIGEIANATEDQAALFECGPACPLGTDMQTVANQLLARLWNHVGLPESDRWAIDSGVIPTFFPTRGHGPAVNIDPNWVPDEAKADADLGFPQVRKDKRSKQRSQSHREMSRELLENAPPPPPKDPKSRKIDPGGPTVAGDFTIKTAGFPHLMDDLRLAWTKDHGARNAFRGGGTFRSHGVVDGRDDHKFVAAGFLPDGSPYPPLLRAFNAVPGGDDKGLAARTLLDRAAAGGVTPTMVSLDRIYTALPGPELDHLVMADGWNLIRDLKGVQRAKAVWAPGVNFLDGSWFTAGMQPGLEDIARPAIGAKKEVRLAIQARFDGRRPYMFRPSGRTTNGSLKLRGPAIPDQILRDKNGTPTDVRGMRVRCANSPYVDLVSRTAVPTKTTCRKGVPCACSTTFVVAQADIPGSYEPLGWGTTKWAKEYYRRNMSEAAMSVSSHHYGLDSRSIRVRAEKWDLAFLFIALATFIRQFRNYLMRLGAWALDPGHWTGLEPEVITAVLERVLTPAVHIPPGSDPPG